MAKQLMTIEQAARRHVAAENLTINGAQVKNYYRMEAHHEDEGDYGFLVEVENALRIFGRSKFVAKTLHPDTTVEVWQ